MEAKAKMTNCPMSARKMKLVVDLIRGKDIDDALNILRYTRKEAAGVAEKVLLSAIANWEYKTDMTENADDYDLFISNVFVNEGSTLKRFRPRAYGRASRIRKRNCHLNIVVDNRLPITEEEE